MPFYYNLFDVKYIKQDPKQSYFNILQINDRSLFYIGFDFNSQLELDIFWIKIKGV